MNLSSVQKEDSKMVVPVVAAYGGVGQAGVTRAVDAVGVGIELGGAATAAGVGDVTAQRR